MNIKLLVCDLDETLLVGSAPPSDRTMAAISKARSLGVRFAIATGRMHISALPYVKILDVDTPTISYNGALIKHHKTDEVIYSHPVAYDDAMDVLRFANDIGEYIQYYSDVEYFTKSHNARSKYYYKHTGVRCKATGVDLIKTLDFDPQKLLICTVNEADGDRVEKLAVSTFGHRLNVVRSSDTFVEFNSLGTSKGVACKNLAKMYNIPMESVMTIGNGGNDYDMITMAGIGVAVRNSADALLAAADYVAPDCKDDGAAIAIEKYIINNNSK